MDDVLENSLKDGCPMENFGDRKIPHRGDVAEQGSEIIPSAAITG
jgi:hypothetical protein